MSVSDSFIPYGRQSIDESDIEAVCDVLCSDWLTTGPTIAEFENAVAEYAGARHAVAVNSGTAALHTAMAGIGIGPGDEVIVPTMTFAATANCVIYQGGTPVLVDVNAETLLIDPAAVETAITSRTKAIIAMDYAGQPCDYNTLREITQKHGLFLIDDGCHALGAEYRNQKIGTLADATCFSFHPVKHITTGEGGMVLTDDPARAERMRRFRNHGINSDHRQRGEQGTWYYEMLDLGFNYRITDFQCALGIQQLKKLSSWLQRRRTIAAQYDTAFRDLSFVAPLRVEAHACHAYHLYVVQIDFQQLGKDRQSAFQQLREQGISCNVHYIPVHLHPYYRYKFGYQRGDFPRAEAAYQKILSLPMYSSLRDEQVERVIGAVRKVVEPS